MVQKVRAEQVPYRLQSEVGNSNLFYGALSFSAYTGRYEEPELRLEHIFKDLRGKHMT